MVPKHGRVLKISPQNTRFFEKVDKSSCNKRHNLQNPILVTMFVTANFEECKGKTTLKAERGGEQIQGKDVIVEAHTFVANTYE